MSRFAITINDDGSVRWHGVDTGKTRILAINREKKLIALHVAGSFWYDNAGQHYGPAHINVHEYEDGPSDRELFLKELFGELEWKPRSHRWTPQQEK